MNKFKFVLCTSIKIDIDLGCIHEGFSAKIQTIKHPSLLLPEEPMDPHSQSSDIIRSFQNLPLMGRKARYPS